MVLRAIPQTDVMYPGGGIVGDAYGLQQVNVVSGKQVDSASLNGVIMIGTFAWGVVAASSNTTQANANVTQLPTGTNPFAGYVWRSQQNVIPWSTEQYGYGFAIQAGQNVDLVNQGTFLVYAPSLNGGGVILAGDILVQSETDGTVHSQTSGTPASGYVVVPGFKIINATPDNIAAGSNIVVMSNVKSF
jgi:hypothetical protein